MGSTMSCISRQYSDTSSLIVIWIKRISTRSSYKKNLIILQSVLRNRKMPPSPPFFIAAMCTEAAKNSSDQATKKNLWSCLECSLVNMRMSVWLTIKFLNIASAWSDHHVPFTKHPFICRACIAFLLRVHVRRNIAF